MVIKFSVEGDPISQGSKNAYVMGKRAVVVDTNDKLLKPWRKLIASKASEEMISNNLSLQDCPIYIKVDFFLSQPKTRSGEIVCQVAPDVDKLARALLDSLTKVVYKDDSRVVRLEANKYYAVDRLPGIDVEVGTYNV